MSVSRALLVLPWARRAPEHLTNITFVIIVISVGGRQSYHCPHFIDGGNEVNDLIRNDPTERSMSLCKDTQGQNQNPAVVPTQAAALPSTQPGAAANTEVDCVPRVHL